AKVAAPQRAAFGPAKCTWIAAAVAALQQLPQGCRNRTIFAAIACRLGQGDLGQNLLRRYALALAVATVALSMSGAGMACTDLRAGPKGTVASVTDGDTVVLDNGLVVRLIGTQAPKLPLGREDFAPWPKAEEAKARLEALTLGQTVEIRHGGAERDRHGRVLGQMFVVSTPELWVQ